MSQAQNPRKIALVLSGGGARGAYEAGVLHYIRTMLPPKQRHRRFDIQCGASVGAINTCFMVATAHDHDFQAKQIRYLWENLRQENIYRRNLTGLFSFLSKSSQGMLFNLFRRQKNSSILHFPGLLDTEPFIPFIRSVIPWKMITRNIRSGLIQALSVVATNVFTGRVELFIQKHPDAVYNGDHIVHYTKIEPEHARASAAIPAVFPTVPIHGIAYTDGGLRLNTPLSPAIHLGADAIFVVGLNHRAAPGEKIPSHGDRGQPAALGQVLGRVMNSVFLDKIQYDIEQLERINHLIESGEELYGENYLKDLNRLLERKDPSREDRKHLLRKIDVLRIRPSEDIGELFRNVFRHHRKSLGGFERFLMRFLDADPNSSTDFLSYIAFAPPYLKRILELGFEDARKQHQALVEFFDR